MFLKFHAQFITLTEIGLSATNQGKDTTPPLPKPSPGFYHENHLIIKIMVQTTPPPPTTAQKNSASKAGNGIFVLISAAWLSSGTYRF
jgi:hypothetical protein